MPSGLFDPTSCSAMMCAPTRPIQLGGIAMTWNEKKRFSEASLTT